MTTQYTTLPELESFADLIGLTLVSVEAAKGDDEARFEMQDGRTGRLYHRQDCCESVSIEDVVGDIADLVGTPILDAVEVHGAEDPDDYKEPEYHESHTWTFYRLTTIKGTVVIRFYGSSNGYYSEGVDWSCSNASVPVPPRAPEPLRRATRRFDAE